MDFKHIEHLVEKYWACETSIEEEKELKDFFLNNDVPAALKETAALFKFYEQEGAQTLTNANFDEEVLAKISAQNAPKKETIIIRWFNQYAKVAAVLMILMVAALAATKVIQQQNEKVQLADTYQDTEDAFEETKKALLLISKNLSKGKSHTMKLTEFNKAEEKIKNNAIEL